MTNDVSREAAGLREAAITRLRKRRDFLQHLMVYAVVNGALILIWFLTAQGGFFWPMFPLIGWGIGVIFHAVDTFVRPTPTEEQIEREMNRLAHR